MPSIEGTIHADDGQAVRFHLSSDGSWRGWGASPDARDEVAPLITAMTEGLLTHSDYYRQDEDNAADAPAGDEADADPVETVLADLTAQFAASHWAMELPEMNTAQLAAARRMAADHLQVHPELLNEGILPEAPPLVIPAEEYIKHLPEDDETPATQEEETAPAPEASPEPAAEEPLYPFPAPENQPPEIAAHYALAAMFAALDGRDLSTGCTKEEVGAYLIRASDSLTAITAPDDADAEPLYPFPAPEATAPEPMRVATHALASLYASWDGLDLATGCTKAQVNDYAMRANDAIFRDARQHSGAVATA